MVDEVVWYNTAAIELHLYLVRLPENAVVNIIRKQRVDYGDYRWRWNMPGFKSKGAEYVKKEKPVKKQSDGMVSFFSRKEKRLKKEAAVNTQQVTEQVPDEAGDLAPRPHFKNSLQVTEGGGSGELREIFEHFISGGELHPLVEDRAVGGFDSQGSSGKVQVTIL